MKNLIELNSELPPKIIKTLAAIVENTLPVKLKRNVYLITETSDGIMIESYRSLTECRRAIKRTPKVQHVIGLKLHNFPKLYGVVI